MQMSDSSIPQQLQKEEKTEEAMEAEEEERDEKRLCDYCNDAKALLYCRADSAKLCLSCDLEVHSTNQLFSKHTRSQLCDACDSSPASIFCETEHSVLCQNCDWERHSLSLSSLHNRRPIEGFSGFPSVSELLSILGFEDLGSEKGLFLSEESDGLAPSGLDGSGTLGEEYSDLLVWESPSVVSIDDLIVSSNSKKNFQAMGVPPLPKNRNAVCGQHKEEMLRQLREVARLEPFSCSGNAAVKPANGFQSVIGEENLQPQNIYSVCEPDAQPISFPGYEENLLHWCADNEEPPTQVLLPYTFPGSGFDETSAVPNKRSGGRISHDNNGDDAQVHPVTPGTVSVLPKVGPHELNTQERDSAISRYKEKRKTRRYEKHIRYESRKVRAESRTRIKGRFAKMNH